MSGALDPLQERWIKAKPAQISASRERGRRVGASGGVWPCCLACSRWRICSAVTPASSMPCAASTRRPRLSSASRLCWTCSMAASRDSPTRESDFGVEFDSLADVISFGIAPAILSFAWGLSSLGRLGWAAGFLFVTAAAMRLARFNIQSASGGDKRYFVGMPSPAAAGVPAATVFAYPVGLYDPARGVVCPGDGARSGRLDGQHDPVPQFQDHRPPNTPGRTRCCFSSPPASCSPLRTHAACSSRWRTRIWLLRSWK